jgi:hypothetical protein
MASPSNREPLWTFFWNSALMKILPYFAAQNDKASLRREIS